MKTSVPRSTPARHRTPGTRRTTRKAVAIALALAFPLTATGSALAATGVVDTNPNKLIGRGAVDTTTGFPAWYQDSNKLRLELCLDAGNPYCGFLPGDIPDPSAPVAFPGHFPEEAFYFLAGSQLALPGGGKAVLTEGLEAAFANQVQNGDQMVFGRVRIVVSGAPRSTTLLVKHPYGTARIDTDATGAGRVVEDIGASVGAFDAALKSNIGPFLVASTGPVTGPDGSKYVGNPDVTTTVTGGLNNNVFAVTGGGLDVSTNQFTIQGRIASNTGVQADAAVAKGGFLDVFATSEGTSLEVVGGTGYATTGMVHDPGTNRFYARVKLTGDAGSKVTVRNLSDSPVSTSTVDVTTRDVTVDRADFDGANLHVTATAADNKDITLDGLGTVTSGVATSIPLTAPPAVVTARQGASTATRVVTVTDGGATVPLPPVAPSPVIDTTPGGVTSTSTGATVPGVTPTPAGPVAVVAAPAVTLLRGVPTTLDASASTGASSYRWAQVSGPTATLTGETTAKPTVTLPLATTAADAKPATIDNTPAVFEVTATGAVPAGGGAAPTSTARVTITPDVDGVAVTAARHRIGNELRIDGTSLFGGQARALVPTTQVTIWDTTAPAAPVKLGTVAVDTLGAWSLRTKPGPTRQVTSILVQTSRGGSATSAVAAK